MPVITASMLGSSNRKPKRLERATLLRLLHGALFLHLSLWHPILRGFAEMEESRGNMYHSAEKERELLDAMIIICRLSDAERKGLQNYSAF